MNIIRITALTLLPIAAFADAPPANFETVVDTITVDLNDDGYRDRAVLFEGTKPFGRVAIYLWDKDEDALHFHASLRQEQWLLRGAGDPALETNASGSLLVHTENIAFTRNRWRQSITISYRDGQFVVSGYDYSWYDTLDLENTGTCSVNYLGRKMETNLGKPILRDLPDDVVLASIEDWSSENVPDICFGTE